MTIQAIAVTGAVFLLFGILLAPLYSRADTSHGFAKINEDAVYPTIEAAIQGEVRAAMSDAANIRREIAGVIYKHNDHFHPSTWVHGAQHNVVYDIGIYKSAPVAAVWHVHPDPDPRMSDGFSEADVKNAAIMQADSYLGVVTTDKIRKLPYRMARRDGNGNYPPMWGEVTRL